METETLRFTGWVVLAVFVIGCLLGYNAGNRDMCDRPPDTGFDARSAWYHACG